MTDATAFRAGVAVLLSEIQRIKAEADYEAAARFFAEYGTTFDPALRDEIVARNDALDLPAYSGFVQPVLEPVRDASGAIADVAISYPCDFTAQMLGYSERYRMKRDWEA
jgi:dipeptidyl-peptidase-3